MNETQKHYVGRKKKADKNYSIYMKLHSRQNSSTVDQIQISSSLRLGSQVWGKIKCKGAGENFLG